jgi:hypothetical protein
MEDAGIQEISRYRSYSGGRTTVVLLVPSFEAWARYHEKVVAVPPDGLWTSKYYVWKDEICYAAEPKG